MRGAVICFSEVRCSQEFIGDDGGELRDIAGVEGGVVVGEVGGEHFEVGSRGRKRGALLEHVLVFSNVCL